MGKVRNKVLRAFWPCLAVFAVTVATQHASAQVTSAQQSAIKSSCRSDFMSKCSGVTPGGKDALICLQKNVASLSPACQTAVSATLPPPAPAAAKPADAAPQPAAPATAESPSPAPSPAAAPATPPTTPAPAPKATVAKPAKPATPAAAVAAPGAPTAAQQSAMKQACRSDFMAKCSGVTPGGKDALVCLQRNVSGLSPSCKQVVSATMGAPAPAAGAAVAPVAVTPAAPADVAVAPAGGPTPQQLSAVKFTCRADFKRHCGGVQPGGPEALACLQRNAARLTPDCKTSLADIGDAVPAGAATSTPATAPAAATVERRRLPPGITPAGRIIRRVMERNQ
jgi:hypothetical protein